MKAKNDDDLQQAIAALEVESLGDKATALDEAAREIMGDGVEVACFAFIPMDGFVGVLGPAATRIKRSHREMLIRYLRVADEVQG